MAQVLTKASPISGHIEQNKKEIDALNYMKFKAGDQLIDTEG